MEGVRAVAVQLEDFFPEDESGWNWSEALQASR